MEAGILAIFRTCRHCRRLESLQITGLVQLFAVPVTWERERERSREAESGFLGLLIFRLCFLKGDCFNSKKVAIQYHGTWEADTEIYQNPASNKE